MLGDRVRDPVRPARTPRSPHHPASRHSAPRPPHLCPRLDDASIHITIYPYIRMEISRATDFDFGVIVLITPVLVIPGMEGDITVKSHIADMGCVGRAPGARAILDPGHTVDLRRFILVPFMNTTVVSL